MSDRDSSIILALGLLVAVVVHVVALGGAQQWGLARAADDRERRRDGERMPMLEAPLALGRADATQARVAWIAHDDYRELLARQARTEQPALQDEVDPTDDAPLNIEPAPAPAPVTPAPATPPPSAAEGGGAAVLPGTAGLAATDPLALGELPGPPDGSAPPLPGPSRDAAAPSTDAAAETSAHEVELDRPTAAPRADAAVDPVRIDGSELERVGEVLVGPGIEVTPARAQISAISWMTSRPRDTRVTMTFSPGEGSVIEARLLRSTGYADWDAAIRTSLYRWRMAGERIEQADRSIVLEIDYRIE